MHIIYIRKSYMAIMYLLHIERICSYNVNPRHHITTLFTLYTTNVIESKWLSHDAYTLNIHSTGNVNRSLTWERHSLNDIFRFTGSCHWISSGTARNENVNKMTTFPFQRWIWCCESNYSFTRYILISITFVIIGKGNSLSPIHRSNQCWPTDVTTMNIHQ